MSEPNYNLIVNPETRTCQIEDRMIRYEDKTRLRVETSRFLLVKQPKGLV